MTEYRCIKDFSMVFTGTGKSKDYSDTITSNKGQILELRDGVDLVFRIKGPRIGVRLDPFIFERCLEEVPEEC